MITKKTRDIFSVIIATAAGAVLLYTVFNLLTTPDGSIYTLCYSSVTAIVFCTLFIAFAAARAPAELFSFDVPGFVCALILSVLIVINAPIRFIERSGDFLYLSATSILLDRPVYFIAVFVFYLVFLYFLFAAIRTLAFSGALLKQPNNSSKYIYIQLALMAAAYICIFHFLYQPYFPYGSSPDTQNQWEQIHGSLYYNRIHAIGHTVFLRALLSLWDNHIIVIVFHIAAIILIYILFSHYFCTQNIRPFVIGIVFCFGLFFTCAFDPTYTAFFFPWKDTPAAICLAFVCFYLIKFRQNGKISVAGALILGVALAGCFLFRLNGIIALSVCGTFFAISFVAKRHYRQLFSMLISIVISISFVNVYSEKVLKPVDYENGFSVQVFASGIAAMVDSGELSAEELAEVDKIISTEWMRDFYRHYIYKQALIWGNDNSPEIEADRNLEMFNNQFVLDLGENKAEVIRLYFKLMPRHLGVCIKDILGSIYLMWSVPDIFMYSYPFVLLLLIFMSIKAKLSPADCVVFLPSLCNTVSIMISTITNEKRYLLPTFVLAPVYFLYILTKNRENNSAEAEAPIISK